MKNAANGEHQRLGTFSLRQRPSPAFEFCTPYAAWKFGLEG